MVRCFSNTVELATQIVNSSHGEGCNEPHGQGKIGVVGTGGRVGKGFRDEKRKRGLNLDSELVNVCTMCNV